MKTTIAVALAATLLCGTGISSAVLAADPPELAMVDAPAADWGGFYAKVYGGITRAGTLDYNYLTVTTYDVDRGDMAGASLGIGTGLDGLSLELDLTGSKAFYTGSGDSLAAVTLMANAVLELPLGDAFGVYAGAGIGGVAVAYDGGGVWSNADGVAAAGQVFAGVAAHLTDNLSLFGEVRHQSAFDVIEVTDPEPISYDLEFNRTAVLVGLKLSM